MQPPDTAAPTGDIVTFYSYKGGTGRSMALANIGVILARTVVPGDKPILMIDWDLEAPGLYKYFSDAPSSPPRVAMGLRGGANYGGGLIDLLTDVAGEYARLDPEGSLPEAAAWTEPALQVFAEITARFPTKNYCLPVGQAGLFLMSSGRFTSGFDDHYAAKIREFRWEEFYLKYGSFFTLWRTKLMEQYQSVLIDSRTGLTDSSGICTRVMPGSLVAVFVPNEQNLDGLSGVIRASLEYRRQSRDQRQIVVYPLASRIDGQSGDLRDIWWHGGYFAGRQIRGYQERFEELLKELYDLDECILSDYFDDTQIPHDSAYAYGERIASMTSTSDSLSIGSKCANLAARLRARALPWETPEDTTKAKIAAARAQAEKAKQLAEAESAKQRAEAESAKRQAETLQSKSATQSKVIWFSVTATLLGFLTTILLYLQYSAARERDAEQQKIAARTTDELLYRLSACDRVGPKSTRDDVENLLSSVIGLRPLYAEFKDRNLEAVYYQYCSLHDHCDLAPDSLLGIAQEIRRTTRLVIVGQPMDSALKDRRILPKLAASCALLGPVQSTAKESRAAK